MVGCVGGRVSEVSEGVRTATKLPAAPAVLLLLLLLGGLLLLEDVWAWHQHIPRMYFMLSCCWYCSCSSANDTLGADACLGAEVCGCCC